MSLEADLRQKLGNDTFELLENLADKLSEQKLERASARLLA